MAYLYIPNPSKYLESSYVIVLVCQSWSSENRQGSPWTNPCPHQLAERRGEKLTVRQCFFLCAIVSLTKMSLPPSHSEQKVKYSFPSVFSIDCFSPPHPTRIWAMRKRLPYLIFSDTILPALEFSLKAVRIAWHRLSPSGNYNCGLQYRIPMCLECGEGNLASPEPRR